MATVSMRIHPNAFDPDGPLDVFKDRANPSYARPLQYPAIPLPIGVTGTTGAPGPGFIASASPQTYRTNIREDGTFPPALAASPPGATGEVGTLEQKHKIIVHVSPTSGSTVIRGMPFLPSSIELNPAYGVDVGVAPVEIQADVFEAALNEPIGGQFKANLQDLVTRGVLEVTDDVGNVMNASDIANYTAP